MIKQTYSLYAMMLLLATILTFFSCAKDSDLFYSAILPETEIIDELSDDQESTEDDDDSTDEGEDSTDEGEDSTDEGEDSTEDEENSTEDEEESTDDGQTGSIIFDTDFETVQWGKNGSAENGKWEVSGKDEVRTTSDARTGNQAIRLGSFNGHKKRNEVTVDRLLGWEEHWIGFSMKIEEETQSARTYMQFRNLRASGGVGEGVINPVTLRQGSSGQLYFQTSTIAQNVNKIYTTGASTGTKRHNLNYVPGAYNDFVIHWILDPEDGLLEIWHNGVKIIDVRGTTTYRYAHIDGEPYDGDIVPTMGVYWSENNAPQGEAKYDSYKVWKGPGGSYENVSPGGLSPESN